MVLEKQEAWLEEALVEQGFPAAIMAGVKSLHPASIAFAREWIAEHKISYGTPQLNEIELYRDGYLQKFGILFGITYESPACC
jgi:hypothetical protein